MDTSEIFSIIMNILSIIGTFSAVIVALYLARRNENPRALISNGSYVYVNNNVTKNYLMVFITNISNIPIEIATSYVLHIGPKKSDNKHLIVNSSVMQQGYTILPIKIEYGRRYDFYIGKDLAINILSKVQHNRKNIEFGFSSTIGQKFITKIKRVDIEKFIKEN